MRAELFLKSLASGLCIKWDLQGSLHNTKNAMKKSNQNILGKKGNSKYQLTSQQKEVYCMVATTVNILKLL